LSAIDIWFSPPLFVNTCLDVFTAPIGETFRRLRDLVASGAVRYIGFSALSGLEGLEAQASAHFQRWAPIITVPASRRLY
jgi:aryl-alcohol dehydrogenase-like predicted oxidoreductase